MSQPFIGQIILVGFDFAPAGYAFCDGSILPIAQNDALFTLIGTTYGGDGQVTFALPDLRGRVPISAGQSPNLQNYILGQRAGAETVTLTVNQLPLHTHAVDTSAITAKARCRSGPGNQQSPVGSVPAIEAAGVTNMYSSAAPDANMSGAATSVGTPTASSAGGSQSHDNMQPFLALNYCISLYGVFPPTQ